MKGNQVSARQSLETFIGKVVKGSVPIPHVDLTQLPNSLDGHVFPDFEAPADKSLKVGDTFNAGGGLTAEVIQIRPKDMSENASYAVRFYYIN